MADDDPSWREQAVQEEERRKYIRRQAIKMYPMQPEKQAEFEKQFGVRKPLSVWDRLSKGDL